MGTGSRDPRGLNNQLQGGTGGVAVLQVYYPYLEDTVEVLRERLRSAFPVPARVKMRGDQRELAVTPEVAMVVRARFDRILHSTLGGLEITWEEGGPPGELLGTVHLATRKQPFALYQQSYGEQVVIRCISPVGKVSPAETEEGIGASVAGVPVRLGVILEADRSYDLTVEDDVLLADEVHDAARIGMLVRRIVYQADLLEQHHLRGKDQPMDAFRSDLEKEPAHGA